jgi:hypothetical protein
MIVPAIGLGILVLFAVGYVISYSIWDKVLKNEKTAPAYIRDAKREKTIERLSFVGGFLAVILMVMVLVSVPRQWQLLSLVLLNVIGIIGGLLTFLIKR